MIHFRIVWIAFLAGVAMLFALGRAPETQPAELQIREARKQFVAAVNAGDLEAAVGLVAPDGLLLVEGAPPVEGREAIRAIGEQSFRAGSGWQLEVEIVRIEHSGHLAYEFSRYRRWPGGQDSGAAALAGKYVDVWRREPDGAWRIVVHAPSGDVRRPSATH